MRHRAESVTRVVILLAIGGMAGAAAFTHVHDLTVAHGQPDWIGWANAVAVELMAIYLGLEIRARRRNGRPVGLVGVLLVGFALLSLAAQVAEAEPSVWGWIVAAVPSLAFLALVKVVLSSAPAIPEVVLDSVPVDPSTAGNEQADSEAESVRQAESTDDSPVPGVTSKAFPSAVRPSLGVVRADRPQVVGIVR